MPRGYYSPKAQASAFGFGELRSDLCRPKLQAVRIARQVESDVCGMHDALWVFAEFAPLARMTDAGVTFVSLPGRIWQVSRGSFTDNALAAARELTKQDLYASSDAAKSQSQSHRRSIFYKPSS